MICKHCGGLVTWRGPMNALTHTECAGCGARDSQELEAEAEDPYSELLADDEGESDA